MKIIMVTDHYPLSPRVKKMRASILKSDKNHIVNVYAWNRNNHIVEENFVTTFNQDIGYGNKKKTLMNRTLFLKEANKFISKEKPDVLHIIDVSLLSLSKKFKNDARIVYEVFDIKFFSRKTMNRIREFYEKKLLKFVDDIIVASPFFIDYYKNKLEFNKNIICINNKPTISVSSYHEPILSKEISEKLSKKIVISFIGTVRHKEIIMNLIKVMENDKIQDMVILLAGDGPCFSEVKEYVEKENLTEKVFFTGRYNIQQLKSLYSVTDFVWAAYPNDNENVKYAVSNKFFESRVFNKPIIVSNKTKLSDKVERERSGISLDPYSLEDIEMKLIGAVNGEYNLKQYDDNDLYWEGEEKYIFDLYRQNNYVKE